MMAIPAGNFGVTNLGDGANAKDSSIRRTGDRIQPPVGNAAISINGFPSSRFILWLTFPGLRQKPTAGGLAGGCLLNSNGRRPLMEFDPAHWPISTGKRMGAVMWSITLLPTPHSGAVR